MRQRLKFAQAVAHDPEILILDEPLSGLDPLSKRKVIRLIRASRDAGKTVLVSSHVLPEIEALTRSIVLLHQGKAVDNIDDDKACRSKLAVEVKGDMDKLLTYWDQWGWHRVTYYGDLKGQVQELAKALGMTVIEEA